MSRPRTTGDSHQYSFVSLADWSLLNLYHGNLRRHFGLIMMLSSKGNSPWTFTWVFFRTRLIREIILLWLYIYSASLSLWIGKIIVTIFWRSPGDLLFGWMEFRLLLIHSPCRNKGFTMAATLLSYHLTLSVPLATPLRKSQEKGWALSNHGNRKPST